MGGEGRRRQGGEGSVCEADQGADSTRATGSIALSSYAIAILCPVLK